MGKTFIYTQILAVSLLSACGLQQGQGAGLLSDWQSFCANREYIGDDGRLVGHPSEAAEFQSYDHYFCGEIKLDLQRNALTIRLNQLVRDYGGGGLRVMGRTADSDDFEVVQLLSASVMDQAIEALESGETVDLENISGGSSPVEQYVEWALASDIDGVIFNQESYFIACDNTVEYCSQMSPTMKAKNWVQAANYMRF
jgi:hypothetical protein